MTVAATALPKRLRRVFPASGSLPGRVPGRLSSMALALGLAFSLAVLPAAALAQAGQAMSGMDMGGAKPAGSAPPPAAVPAATAAPAAPPSAKAPTAPPAPATSAAPAVPATSAAPASPAAPAAPAGQADHGVSQSATPAAPAPAAAGHADHGAPAAPAASNAPMPPMAMLTPEQARQIGVSVAQAAMRPFKISIRATGRITADETRLATVTTKVEGYVENLTANYTGQPVTKGQALLSLYSPEVYAVELEYLSLLRLKQAAPKEGQNPPDQFGGMLQADTQALLAAARQRLALFDAAGLAGQLEKTGRPSRTFSIVSPVTGYVLNRRATLGMRVMPGDKLYDLADLSTVWVLADVYEEQLPYVREGAPAAITLTGSNGPPVIAKVAQVYPVIAGETRTARVRFNLPNPKGLLKPEMYAEILMMPDLGQHLAVPESAVIDTGLRQVVYQETSPNTFEPREVTTGVRSGGFVAVTWGLKPGASVATSANFLLDAETRLKSGSGSGHHHGN